MSILIIWKNWIIVKHWYIFDNSKEKLIEAKNQNIPHNHLFSFFLQILQWRQNYMLLETCKKPKMIVSKKISSNICKLTLSNKCHLQEENWETTKFTLTLLQKWQLSDSYRVAPGPLQRHSKERFNTLNNRKKRTDMTFPTLKVSLQDTD